MQAQRFGRIINLTGGDEPVALMGAFRPMEPPIFGPRRCRVRRQGQYHGQFIPPGRIHSEQIDHRILPTEGAQRPWVEQNCPAGYIGEPEDLAVLVAFLSSPLARYITGQVIYVDGGARRYPTSTTLFTLLPKSEAHHDRSRPPLGHSSPRLKRLHRRPLRLTRWPTRPPTSSRSIRRRRRPSLIPIDIAGRGTPFLGVNQRQVGIVLRPGAAPGGSVCSDSASM